MLPDAFRTILDRISTANADGLRMIGQVAPRAVGLILGLECTLNPFMTVPAYQEIAERPLAERVALLRDPAVRAGVLQAAEGAAREKLGGSLVGRFDLLFEMLDEPDYEPKLSDSIAARAARDGVTPEELALDVMLAGDGHGLIYLPFLNYVDGNLDGCHEMLVHPYTVPGLGDGGAHVGTICDGSFPTTLLQYWGRDPRPRHDSAAVPRATPLPRHRPHGRARRPRCRSLPATGPTSTWSTSNACGCASRRSSTTCRRAGGGSCNGPTVGATRSWRVRRRTTTARPPTHCPVGSCAAP